MRLRYSFRLYPSPGNSGFRAPQQGAEVSVHLAALPDDDPSGVFWGYVWTADGTESYGVLPRSARDAPQPLPLPANHCPGPRRRRATYDEWMRRYRPVPASYARTECP